jgi:hypothetical protein
VVVYEQHRVFRSDDVARLEERRVALIDSVDPPGIFMALDTPDRYGPAWSKAQLER